MKKIYFAIIILVLTNQAIAQSQFRIIHNDEFIGCYAPGMTETFRKLSQLIYDVVRQQKALIFVTQPLIGTNRMRGFYLKPYHLTGCLWDLATKTQTCKFSELQLDFDEVPKQIPRVLPSEIETILPTYGITIGEYNAAIAAIQKATMDVACCPAMTVSGSCSLSSSSVWIPGFGNMGVQAKKNQFLFSSPIDYTSPFNFPIFTEVTPDVCKTDFVNTVWAELGVGGKCDMEPTCSGDTGTDPPPAEPKEPDIIDIDAITGFVGESNFDTDGEKNYARTGVSKFYSFNLGTATHVKTETNLSEYTDNKTILYQVTTPSQSNLAPGINYTVGPGSYIVEHSSENIPLPVIRPIDISFINGPCQFNHTIGTTETKVMYMGNGAAVCPSGHRYSFNVATADTGMGKKVLFTNAPASPNPTMTLKKGTITKATGTSSVTLSTGASTDAGDYTLDFGINNGLVEDVTYTLKSEKQAVDCSTKSITLPYWSGTTTTTDKFKDPCRSLVMATQAANRFAFSVPNQTRIGIRALNSVSTSNPFLRVFGSDGTTLLWQDDNGSKDKDAMVSQVFNTGTYIFEVADAAWTNGNTSEIGFYLAAQPVSYKETCDNNITIPSTTGNIPFQIDGKLLTACNSTKKTPVRGAQYFTFTTTTATTAYIYVSAIPATGEDLIMYLSSGSKTGTQLAYGDSGSATGSQDALIQYTSNNLPAGTYTLEITSYYTGRTPTYSVFIQQFAP